MKFNKFNKFKAEEQTLIRLLLERFSVMNKSGEYTFEDGALCSEFINNSQEWYRSLKAKAACIPISAHSEKILLDYQTINTKYHFDITIARVQENTIYSYSSCSREHDL